MTRYLVGRALQFLPTLLVVAALAFYLIRSVADPLAMYVQDPGMRPEDVARLRAHHGLDRPLPMQFLYWLRDMATGDWGTSLYVQQPVFSLILERLPNTLLLMGSAFALSLTVAVPLGIYSAVRRYSWADYLLTGAAFAAYATPSFWLGILLILFFNVQFSAWGLPALPAGGMYDLAAGRSFLSMVRHLILPTLVLSVLPVTTYTRYLRSAMIEILEMDYIRTARAKGLSPRTVHVRHAFRNACAPLVALISLDIPRLFSGALVTEQVFAWPGMGRLFVDHAFRGDYPVLMGLVVCVAGLVALASLIADLLYAFLDPTIRYDVRG
ncbi:MAG: ABC transporter permease [Armatimonadota bacterium]|nr:ABC transporter permease [Armatimonadota bacterium]